MTKTLPKFAFAILIACIIGSCSNEEECPDCPTCGENMIYGPISDGGAIAEIIPEIVMDTVVSENQEFAENKVKIEKKFGEQWDFCHCVVANDSLDKVVKSGAELGDAFMARFEEVDQKCKAFLVMSPNQTPEERDAHEKKIKKCLRNRRN